MYISDFCCISPCGLLLPESNPDDHLVQESMQKGNPENNPPTTFPTIPFPEAHPEGKQYRISEPDFSQWISPVKLRRMPRSVKLAMAAMKNCFGTDQPATIHIGSAFCMLSDSEVFLKNLIDLKEEALPPTPFIQSTHNTISGALALELQVNGHNFTFSHRGHSFENALLDAELYASEENQGNQFQLVGGVEELTPLALKTLYQAGCASENSLAPGEGTALFKMSPKPRPDSLVAVVDFQTEKINPANRDLLMAKFQAFCKQQETEILRSDLLLTGNNLHPESEKTYNHLRQNLFPQNRHTNYLEYCGIYPTASAFGLGFSILKLQQSLTARQCWIIGNYGSYWSFWLIRKM